MMSQKTQVIPGVSDTARKAWTHMYKKLAIGNTVTLDNRDLQWLNEIGQAAVKWHEKPDYFPDPAEYLLAELMDAIDEHGELKVAQLTNVYSTLWGRCTDWATSKGHSSRDVQ